jgi:hypothetical protein
MSGSARKAVVVLSALSLFLVVHTVCADGPALRVFDGHRRGFVFSMGVGTGLTTVAAANCCLTGSLTKATVVLSQRLGYAPTERLEIYEFYRACVYADELWRTWHGIASASGMVAGVSHAVVFPAVPIIAILSEQHFVTGLGVSYHLKPSPPGWCAKLGVGPALLSDPWQIGDPPVFPAGLHTGIGLLAGIAYEFSAGGEVNLEFLYSRASWESGGFPKQWSVASVALTLAYALY